MRIEDPDRGQSMNRLLKDTIEQQGPSIDEVLATVRAERSRRNGRRLILVGLMLASMVVITQQRRPGYGRTINETGDATLASSAPTMAGPDDARIQIEPLSDDQLLAAVSSLPTALIRSSDGTRRLLIIKPD